MSYPVIIIVRDRVTPLKKLVAALERAQCPEIFLLDNGSTYRPLLEYLKLCPHTVVPVPTNEGPDSPWSTRTIHRLFESYRYVGVSDCDVYPDVNCPGDFLEAMASALDDYPTAPKAGLSIRMDDLPPTYRHASTVLEWETQFWIKPVGKGARGELRFSAPIDTTLALYRNADTHRAFDREAIRLGKPYTLKHAPWYEDSSNLSDEERYYQEHASRATTWSNAHMKLNLGCGHKILPGYVNVDRYVRPGVTEADLTKVWPWADSTIDEIIASHVIEHLPDRILTMNEAYRVLADGGLIHIEVPTTEGSGAFQDPTHCCYSDDTDILTPTGFKRITEIKAGDLITTMDPETSLTVDVPCDHMVDEPYEGDMLLFRTKRMDLMVTPKHRLWAAYTDNARDLKFKWILAEALVDSQSHHPVVMRSDFKWIGDKSKTSFTFEPTHTNEARQKAVPLTISAPLFMKFFGWWVSEGWVNIQDGSSVFNGKKHYANTIGIAQSESVHPEHFEEIESMLQEMGLSTTHSGTSIVCQHKGLCEYLAQFGHSHEKFIPSEIKNLSKELLQIFITSYLKGDGTPNGKGFLAGTVSPRLASDLQEIAIKCGYRSTIFIEKRAGKTFKLPGGIISNNCKDIHMVSFAPPANMWASPPEKVSYNGRVYCPMLPKHHLVLARRNGRAVWSGNSFWNRRSFLYYENGNLYRDTLCDAYGIKAKFDIVSEHITQTMDGPILSISLRAVKP